MSLLDNRIFGITEHEKQAIRDIFIELINDCNNKGQFTDISGKQSQLFSDAELRQKVSEL